MFPRVLSLPRGKREAFERGLRSSTERHHQSFPPKRLLVPRHEHYLQRFGCEAMPKAPGPWTPLWIQQPKILQRVRRSQIAVRERVQGFSGFRALTIR